MSDDQAATIAEAFATFGRELGEAITGASVTLYAQGAIGWLVQDRPDLARRSLELLTDEQRRTVAAAAVKLIQIAAPGSSSPDEQVPQVP